MTEPELKSCPFCGEEAVYEENNDHHGDWFNLGCAREKCHAHNAFYTEDLSESKQAIEAWNNRVHKITPLLVEK